MYISVRFSKTNLVEMANPALAPISIFQGAGEKHSVVYWWNHSPYKFSSVAAALASKRPLISQYLLANVYSDLNGMNRMLGGSNFPVGTLVSKTKSFVSSETLRHHSSSKAGVLTISNFSVPVDHVYNVSDYQRKSRLIKDIFASESSTYGYNTVKAHINFWDDPFAFFREKNPKVSRPSNLYAEKGLEFFRIPLWWWGSGYVVPGPYFCWHLPVTSTSEEALLLCLTMAKDRANINMDVQNMTTTQKGIVLSFFLAAYAHCVPYSFEMNPIEPKKMNEYFSPARLRATGDCEDTSYEIVQTFRDLINTVNLLDSQLKALQKFARGFTAWMTLGSATAASAESATSEKKTIMAHMYVLLLPNHMLNTLGVDTQGRPAPTDCGPPLLVEGTGIVHPYQTQETEFPPFMTPRGKEYMDKIVKRDKLQALRRFIFDPPSKENKHITGEFYKLVVSAIADTPDIGMYVFFTDEGVVGAPLNDILTEKNQKIRMIRVPGTKSTDNEFKADADRIWAMKGFHEPVYGYHVPKGNNIPTSHGLVKFMRSLPELQKGDTYDIQFVIPGAELGTKNETKVLDVFTRDRDLFSSGRVVKHQVGNSGALLIQFKLKPLGGPYEHSNNTGRYRPYTPSSRSYGKTR